MSTSQHGSVFDPLLGVSWWFRDAGSAHSLHEPSLRPARRFGTLYQAAGEIWILAGTTSDVCWKRTYVHCTEAFSVLDIFQDDTLCKVTYLLTYLLMGIINKTLHVVALSLQVCTLPLVNGEWRTAVFCALQEAPTEASEIQSPDDATTASWSTIPSRVGGLSARSPVTESPSLGRRRPAVPPSASTSSMKVSIRKREFFYVEFLRSQWSPAGSQL